MKSSFINITRQAFLVFAGSLLLVACKKDNESSGNPHADKIDPGEAPANEVITVTGTGLSGIQSIVFDNGNVPADFNPNFNTDNAVIFRVPDTANGGDQNIVLTNSAGQSVKVPFKVIALATVSEISTNNFTAGAQITIKGNNLDDVTKIVLKGTTDEATIVSKSKRELVVTMPSTSVNYAPLEITNLSGTATTTQEFVNLDNAFKIFTDSYAQDFSDGSWGDAGTISSTVFKTGTASVGKKYQAGQWHLINFANWWPGLTNDPAYKYLSFWVKGASQDYALYITSDKGVGGFGATEESNRIDVPKNVWTYFRIPLSTLKLWEGGNTLNQLGFRIKGPDAQDETFYFDDLVLLK
jgi:hypothetical protein